MFYLIQHIPTGSYYHKIGVYNLFQDIPKDVNSNAEYSKFLSDANFYELNKREQLLKDLREATYVSDHIYSSPRKINFKYDARKIISAVVKRKYMTIDNGEIFKIYSSKEFMILGVEQNERAQ
jgi:hypothetical protein